MKRLFGLMALAFAINVSAQEMIVNKKDGSVLDKLSLSELHKTTHITSAEGKRQLKVELRNGASYTCNIDDIVNTDITTKDDMLKRGKFAKMKMLKTFSSVQDLNEGDLIGIIDEQDYDFDGFVAEAYSALGGNSTSPIVSNIDPETIKTLATVLNAAFKANLEAYALKQFINSKYIRFHVTNIVYVGKDIDGTKIPLSARLIYPYSTSSNRNITISNLYLEQHTTLFEDNAEPSAQFYPFSCSAVVFNGYMVIQPDLLGFGVSNMRSQMFVNRDVNGAACADCIMAAVEYARLSKENKTYVPVNLKSDASIISVGSSQGASTAMGFTYYMENKVPTSIVQRLPKISENHLCAGAFNPQVTFEEFVQRDSLNGFLVPVMVSSAVTSRPDIMRHEDGSLIMPYEFLNPALKDMTWDGMESDGIPANMTIWQMLNSKYGSSTIFAKMFRRDFPYEASPQYASFHKMIADGIMTKDAQGNYSLNYADNRVAGLKKYFDENNLTDANLWIPKSDITILHSINDATVPFKNSQMFYDNMYMSMKDNGKTLTLDAYDNPTNMSHVMICLVWMMAEVTGLPATTLLSLLSSM